MISVFFLGFLSVCLYDFVIPLSPLISLLYIPLSLSQINMDFQFAQGRHCPLKADLVWPSSIAPFLAVLSQSPSFPCLSSFFSLFFHPSIGSPPFTPVYLTAKREMERVSEKDRESGGMSAGGRQIAVKGLRVDSYAKGQLTPLIQRKRVEMVGGLRDEGEGWRERVREDCVRWNGVISAR